MKSFVVVVALLATLGFGDKGLRFRLDGVAGLSRWSSWFCCE